MTIVKNFFKGLLIAFLLSLIFTGSLVFLVNFFLPPDGVRNSIYFGLGLSTFFSAGLLVIWITSIGIPISWGIRERTKLIKTPDLFTGKKFFYLLSFFTLVGFLLHYLNLSLNFVY